MVANPILRLALDAGAPYGGDLDDRYAEPQGLYQCLEQKRMAQLLPGDRLDQVGGEKAISIGQIGKFGPVEQTEGALEHHVRNPLRAAVAVKPRAWHPS